MSKFSNNTGERPLPVFLFPEAAEPLRDLVLPDQCLFPLRADDDTGGRRVDPVLLQVVAEDLENRRRVERPDIETLRLQKGLQRLLPLDLLPRRLKERSPGGHGLPEIPLRIQGREERTGIEDGFRVDRRVDEEDADEVLFDEFRDEGDDLRLLAAQGSQK